MKTEYKDWIKQHYPTKESAYGNCRTASERMAAEFPELTKVDGFVEDCFWGERMHGWCITAKGEVVDPTRHQFPFLDSFSYRIVKAEDRPVGLCVNCGELSYHLPEVCSEKCNEALCSYLNSI